MRGLKEITYTAYRRFLTPFILGLCHDGPPQWQELNGPYISHFVTAELEKAASGRRTVIAGVRNFLWYLISQGLVARGFLRAIPRIRSWRYSNLTHPLTAEEHEMVLKACQTPESGSLRDRAFVATLALLGLRGGELRQLRLDDIEWKEGVIHIRHGKGDRERTLPLPKEAGALIADYIRLERPQSVYREAFLTVLSPRVPFSGSMACYLVRQ